jgi:protease I
VQGKNGLEATADVEVEAVSADAVDAVVVPGGWAPDKLRRYDAVKELDDCFRIGSRVSSGDK